SLELAPTLMLATSSSVGSLTTIWAGAATCTGVEGSGAKTSASTVRSLRRAERWEESPREDPTLEEPPPLVPPKLPPLPTAGDAATGACAVVSGRATGAGLITLGLAVFGAVCGAEACY